MAWVEQWIDPTPLREMEKEKLVKKVIQLEQTNAKLRKRVEQLENTLIMRQEPYT